MRRLTSLLIVALTCATDAACAQHMQPSGDATANAVRPPFEVRTFGVFRKLMLEGDFSAKVSLADAMAKHPTTGVGALADARGEITIYDGRLIVSYGEAGRPADPNAASAALLVMGSAGAWQNVTVDRDVAPAEIESYLAAAAKAHGLDPEKSFPYQGRGVVAPFAMHVNVAATGGPHGMGRPMAVTVERQGNEIEGRIAGLYVSADLVGVATHGGERTHTHWVSSDGTATAHLERWGLKAGTVLLLPKP